MILKCVRPTWANDPNHERYSMQKCMIFRIADVNNSEV
jgi:hypothetical protein